MGKGEGMSDIVERLREIESNGMHYFHVRETLQKAAEEILRLRAELATAKSELEQAQQAMEWQPIETAPMDGTVVLVPYQLNGNDVHGYAPWTRVRVVMAWNTSNGWEMCFMEDGAADSEGFSSQFFMSIPTPTHWLPLPRPPGGKK